MQAEVKPDWARGPACLFGHFFHLPILEKKNPTETFRRGREEKRGRYNWPPSYPSYKSPPGVMMQLGNIFRRVCVTAEFCVEDGGWPPSSSSSSTFFRGTDIYFKKYRNILLLQLYCLSLAFLVSLSYFLSCCYYT